MNNKCLLRLVAALLLIATAHDAMATVFYVKAGAQGDGSSWENAQGNLQAAIEAAQAGDQVWVAQGTYRPDSLIQARRATSYAFMLKDGVSLYGGFAGNESSIEQREIKPTGKPYDFVHETILSADDSVPDVWVREIAEGTSFRLTWRVENNQVLGTEGNGSHVLYRAEVIANPTEINGFTLTGANANVYQVKAYGGALYALGNVQLRACRVVENSGYFRAQSITDSNTYGGAVFLNGAGNAAIEQCYFARNYCHSSYGNGLGGAIFARNVAISDCDFADCVAEDAGGAIYNMGGTIARCTFSECYGGSGGAVYNDGTVSDVTIMDCRALLGGGIFNYGTVTNAVVANCYADAPEYGDALGGRGGGMLIAGGSVNQAAVFNNMAFWGGGIYMTAGALANSTVQHNIIRANLEADTANVGMVNHDLFDSMVFNSITADAEVSNFAQPTTWRGIALDAADTLAIHSANWALATGSQFIDAGTWVSQYATETDLAGNARIAGERIDVGAYEFQPQTHLKGDVNGDGVVDVNDVNILLNIVLGKDAAEPYDGRANVDGEGDVDVNDVNILINIILGI
ncbi:MAG: right-handed parallel beta-helix repeat-containing protein [Muribaculaceae bacterium]|nr:right-handed parallel beta-helix repeat-containing protein [Muribaculaceae bacterium]